MRRAWRAMPGHVRFLLGHAAIGVLVGFAFVAALIGLDIGGLRGLLLRGPDGAIALALLASGASVTFGSAAMGAAVMGLGATPRPPRPPAARGARALQPAPVRR